MHENYSTFRQCYRNFMPNPLKLSSHNATIPNTCITLNDDKGDTIYGCAPNAPRRVVCAEVGRRGGTSLTMSSRSKRLSTI